MLVHEAIHSFLEHLNSRIRLGANRPATREYYRWQLKHLEKIASDVELSSVTLGDLCKGPISHHYVRSVRRLFAFHKVAIPDGFSGHVKGQRHRTLDACEFRRLWQAMPGHTLPLAAKLIYYTGLRPQEVRGLEWKDISERNRIIQLHNFKAKHLRRDGLTVRAVPIPIKACRLFWWVRNRIKPQPTDKVFVSSRMGRALTSSALSLAFRRAFARAGLQRRNTERACIYTLRHTFATNFIRQGGDSIKLKSILGHTNLNMTSRYCHPTPDDLVRGYDISFKQSGHFTVPTLSEELHTPQPHGDGHQTETSVESEPASPMIDKEEAGRLLGCHGQTLIIYAQKGKFPAPTKNGRKWYWDRSAIEEWIAANGHEFALSLEVNRRHRGKSKEKVCNDPFVMDTKEFAARLKCSRTQLVRLANEGLVPPPAKLGKKTWRWARVVVEQWLAQGCPAIGGTRAVEK